MDSWQQRLQYTGKSFAVVVGVNRSSFCLPQTGHVNHPRFVFILPHSFPKRNSAVHFALRCLLSGENQVRAMPSTLSTTPVM